MKRRMIERTNERTNERSNKWMNEWMNGYKKKGIHWWTEEWIEEIKIQRVKYIAFLVLSYRSKTSLSRGGFGGFWMRHSKFTWSSTRLCNIFMTSPRWQFISCQYSTFLPLYSTEDKWYALLSPGISCSPPPPPPPPRFSTPSPQPTNDVWSPRKKHDSTWHFKNSLLRHSLHVETHARKLTILGCLSPPKDFPNSISCANDSCSWSEQLPVIVMCRQRNR